MDELGIPVGAPLGLDSTVTTGIVSALNRPVTPGQADDQSFINAIQTDAAINPGNSGGPLLDMQGRVIGVNTAIARVAGSNIDGQSGNIGVGFAIPSDQVKITVDQLIRTGKAERRVVMTMRNNSLAWSPTFPTSILLASEDHNLYTFDIRHLDTPTQIYKAHVAAVMSCDWAPTGLEFVSGGWEEAGVGL